MVIEVAGVKSPATLPHHCAKARTEQLDKGQVLARPLRYVVEGVAHLVEIPPGRHNSVAGPQGGPGDSGADATAGAGDEPDLAYNSLPFIRASIPGLVLLVGNVFHPLDDFAVERFLDRDVRYRRGCGCAMPVFFAGGNPNDVAGADLLLRPAP